MPQRYDIAIIGAGAAGLAAAALFAPTGHSVVILEARDRIGGRVWTRTEPGLAVPIELGAEFIHGRAEPTLAMLERAAIPAVYCGGPHWSIEGGRLLPRDEFFPAIQRVMKKAVGLPKDMSLERFLAGRAGASLKPAARQFALKMVEGFDAADPARVSARAIGEEWTGGGAVSAEQLRPQGGYGALLSWLAQQLATSGTELRLQSEVDAITWRRGEVEIAGVRLQQRFTVRATRAIVTLPLGVLQAESVAFSPRTIDKDTTIQRLIPGSVVKVALRFSAPFWEAIDEARAPGAAFFHAPEAPFRTFWTALPVRAPLLIAWVGGPRAERLSENGDQHLIDAAVSSAETVFGARAVSGGKLQAAYVHDWRSDPYSKGAYSYVAVDGGGARKALAAPVQDTLYFAGEAAEYEGEAGTVAGALQSGLRAARAILKRMGSGSSR
jgi:monoamine oxidase